jgi:hypothetical protein
VVGAHEARDAGQRRVDDAQLVAVFVEGSVF